MPKHTCPWWLGYLLASPIRRWLQDPVKILAPYVHEGMTVLEPGPGMGFFTLELARLVGASGRVIAVDVQPRMIAELKRRAAKAGMTERVHARVATSDSMCLSEFQNAVDFALAFAVAHEFPSADRFFGEVAETSKPGALLLFVEPSGHVKPPKFEAELQAAASAGFTLLDRPDVTRSRSALLKKA